MRANDRAAVTSGQRGTRSPCNNYPSSHRGRMREEPASACGSQAGRPKNRNKGKRRENRCDSIVDWLMAALVASGTRAARERRLVPFPPTKGNVATRDHLTSRHTAVLSSSVFPSLLVVLLSLLASCCHAWSALDVASTLCLGRLVVQLLLPTRVPWHICDIFGASLRFRAW